MRRGFAAALLFLASVAAFAAEPDLHVDALTSPVKVRLRGLSAFSDKVAWASGREGTVLRTVDGGASWSVMHVPGAEALDFRDVQAFGPDVALVMGAGPGDASRVYRTANAGRTWTLVLANPDKDGFFDCMDFDGNEGRLLGDPVKGRFQVLATSDGGRSWHWTQGPEASADEAAFAASGTCLLREKDGTAIVTGGAQARILYQPDHFKTGDRWFSVDAKGIAGNPSAGLFSLASRSHSLLAVGGDYKQEKAPGAAVGAFVSVRIDGAQAGDLVFEPEWDFEGVPSNYMSGVACRSGLDADCVATGPGGTDFLMRPQTGHESKGMASPPGPRSHIDVDDIMVASKWRRISDAGYDSVSIAGKVAWFSGDEGRLGRMQLPAPRP